MRHTLVPVTVVLLGVLGVVGCGGEEPVAQPAATATPAAPETVTVTETVTATPTATAPTFPADVAAPEQGGQYYAVVLAAGNDDEIQASLASVAAYGYAAGVSDAACLDGVAQDLGLPDDALVSSLLFADQQAASNFADAYVATEDGLMVGRAPVTAYCLD